MTISQLLMRWDGLPGGTGYSIIYVDTNAPNPLPLQNFMTTVGKYVPPTCTLVVPATGRLIDESNGKMTGVWAAGTQTAVTGTGTGPFAPASGAQVKWDTGGFVNGHKVQGLTYIVPVMTANFGTTGTLLSVMCNDINSAATAMINSFAQTFVIWARPLFEKDADGHPTDVIKRAGSVHKVLTSTCPTKSVTLRGRRDT